MALAAEGFFTSLYAVMQTISIQAPTADVIPIAHEMLDSTGFDFLSVLYGIVLNMLAIATPLVVATTAISSLQKKAQVFKYRVLAHNRKCVYVFSDINESQVALAFNIFKHRREAASTTDSPDDRLHPLVVFCNVTEQVKDEKSDVIQSLRDKGRGDVVFTPASLTNTVSTVIKLKGYEQVHAIAFGDSHETNVEETATLLDRISEDAASMANADEDRAKAFARRLSVYCTHENQEDELIFDSLSSTDESDEEADENLRALKQTARSQIHVRLVSHTREHVFSVMCAHPLFSVLDPIDAAPIAKTQKLYVVIVGLGRNGREALKCAFWMGRMRGVSLRIICIDKDAANIERHLRFACPEMMAEADSIGTPIVQMRQEEVFTEGFSDVLRSIPADARVYSLVTMGDDQLNLNVALSMRRLFDEQILTHGMSDPGMAKRPMILPLISAPETFKAAARMASDRQEPFTITPFGKIAKVFTYRNIIASPWERHALAANAAYDEVWNHHNGRPDVGRGTKVQMVYEDTLHEYNEFEIKKLSNRTSTRHIPYRLWSVGIDPSACIAEDGTFDANRLSLARWHEALGITPEDADKLLRPHPLDEDTRDEMAALRDRYPIVSELSDLEHDRWVAFYRSEGWRSLTIGECEGLVSMGIVSSLSVHQSPKLRRHCYLCDGETLFDRGAALKDDPFAYDRAIVIETQRILAGTIFESAPA